MCSRIKQFLAGLVACMGSFCGGISLGWSSATYKRVVKDGEFGYEVADEQFKWITGLYNLGNIVVFFPASFMCKYIGPKVAMLLSIIPSMIGWGLLMFGNNYYYAYIGIFLIGVTNGSFFICSRLYLIQIAETEVRGMMGVLFQILFAAGIAYAFTCGAFLSTLTQFHIASIIPYALNFISLNFIPESPVYYVTKGQIEKAEKSLKKLRHKDNDIQKELNTMMEESKKLKEADKIECKTLCTKHYSRALGYSFVLLLISQMTGITCLTFYLSNIFMISQVNIQPEHVNIIFGVAPIPCIFLSFFIIDRVGRKTILFVSFAFLVVLGTLFAMYFVFHDMDYDLTTWHWTPAVTVVLYSCSFNFGTGSLLFVICLELFDENFRYMALALCSTISRIFTFILVTGFLPTKEAIGMGPTVFIFVVFDFIGIIFTIVLPETKGKNIDEIQNSLRK